MSEALSVRSLDYPFDSTFVIRKKRQLRKLLSAREGLIGKRIAILGGSTTQQVADFLELFLLAEGIRPEFYQSGYNRYWEDALFGSPELDVFCPDVIVVHTTVRNLRSLGLRSGDPHETESWLEADKERFAQMWDALREKFACPIIQNNFERPPYRLLGNQDICDSRGVANYSFEMNRFLYEYARGKSTFLVHDIDGLSAQLGLGRWHDSSSWCAYKNAFSLSLLPDYSYSLSRVLKALFGANKKVIALDLDNTLWSGIVGDDGVDGIEMGPDTPMGEKHRELQAYLRNLRTTGVVLAVDSKNEESVALDGLSHADCLLPPEMFAGIKANWMPKSANLEELALDLNVGTDSFVFVDDNPAEREIVRQQLDAVTCVPFDDIGQVPALLDFGGYFESVAYTDDDAKRADMYRQNAQRKSLERAAGGYGEYLESLQMKCRNVGFDERYIARIAQLTNKTNQFNLTTERMTEDDIRALAADGEHVCIALTLSDRFGDNGLVSVLIGSVDGSTLVIDLWLMSCRVFKRELEHVAYNCLIEEAASRGVTRIVGHYYPTKRNVIVRDFYKSIGFTLVDEDGAGNSEWIQDASAFKVLPSHIERI